jgi:hypothetical protein
LDAVEIVVGLVVFGALLAGAAWFSKKQGAWAAAAGEKMLGTDLRTMTRWMFERSGFQWHDMQGAPLEAQVERSVGQAGQVFQSSHLVRHRDGFELHFEQRTEQTPSGGVAMSATWWTPCAPPFGLHVADRRIAGVGQAVANVMTNLSRAFSPLFPHEISLHDPALAARFRVWTTDPGQALAYLARPELGAALLALPSVDFALREQCISLADPLMENLTGGRPAHALVGLPAEQIVAAQAQGHEHVARLFHYALGRG